jgi:hypothetical protein
MIGSIGFVVIGRESTDKLNGKYALLAPIKIALTLAAQPVDLAWRCAW